MKNPFLEEFISSNHSFQSEPNRHSSLAAALRDARKIANRNLSTGEVSFEIESFFSPDSWASALLYFIVLDQIGTCFINTKKKALNIQGGEIVRAILNFSDLSETEAYALETLRHCFAHNYGLCNVRLDKSKKEIVERGTFLFELTASPKGELITLPDESDRWRGDFSQKFGGQTKVNVWLFGDFVEKLFSTLREEYENNNVDLQPKISGIDEVKMRFTFFA